jgi:hypothetical protein
MNLRRILFTIFLLAPLLAWCQDDELPENPRVADRVRSLRIAYITDQLKLTPEEAEKFWPIYNDLSEKRMTLRQEYRKAKRNPEPGKTVEENEKALIDLHFKIKQQELDLEKTYYDKLLKVISVQKLNALPEAEKNFRQMIIQQIRRRHDRNDFPKQLKEQKKFR